MSATLPRFAPPGHLSRLVRERIAAWMAAEDGRATARRMRRKSLVIGLWFVASYVLLVFVASSLWVALPLALSLALATAAVAMNVQHDANHGAWPAGRRARRIVGFTLDVLGGSSYVWRYKHNQRHHTFTNIAGADNDIDLRPWGRLTPEHPRRRYHRLQHFYLWPLYALMPLVWQLVEDYAQVARGKIAGAPFPRPRGWSLVAFVGGKIAALALWVGIPLLVHPPLVVIAFALSISALMGVILSITFQLAHATDVTAFPVASDGGLENDWVVHELATTADFAPNSRLAAWFLGGLNFQIEHHLVPGLPHVRYPALARVVRETCAEFGLPYLVHRSVGAAVASHYRWLRTLGRPDGPAAPSAPGPAPHPA